MSSKVKFKPKLIGFMCNWCCYAGADLCGVSRLQYPSFIRIVRVMCSGRVDMNFVFKSFLHGSDGVFLGGCWPADCHYVTEGNYDAYSMMHICKFILRWISINPERLRLEWVSASEGNRFAEVMNDFSNKILSLGPLGSAPGENPTGLELSLKAAMNIVPYIRLVEREKLRVKTRSQTAIDEFYKKEDTQRLLESMIHEKLIEAEISILLDEGAISVGGLAKSLNLTPSQVSGYMNRLSKKGIARFDYEKKAFCHV